MCDSDFMIFEKCLYNFEQWVCNGVSTYRCVMVKAWIPHSPIRFFGKLSNTNIVHLSVISRIISFQKSKKSVDQQNLDHFYGKTISRMGYTNRIFF